MPRQQPYILPCSCWCSGPVELLLYQWKDACRFQWGLDWIHKETCCISWFPSCHCLCKSRCSSLLPIEWWGETFIKSLCWMVGVALPNEMWLEALSNRGKCFFVLALHFSSQAANGIFLWLFKKSKLTFGQKWNMENFSKGGWIFWKVPSGLNNKNCMEMAGTAERADAGGGNVHCSRGFDEASS